MNRIIVGFDMRAWEIARRERRLTKERERNARRRKRNRGEVVPYRKPGPIPGFKYAPQVIALRATPRGETHYRWAGENISEKGGRKRALKAFPDTAPCQRCGANNSERHHKDGDTGNNAASNIEFLCRRCHMEEDGRLAAGNPWRKRINQARRHG